MKTKRTLLAARELAAVLLGQLAPLCQRIEIAGSVRRCKPEIGDLELVAIPNPVLDLFGQPMDRTEVDWWLDDQIPQCDITKNGAKYKQFRFRDMQIDLFLATPDNWGLIYMLRTGPAEFSHAMVTPDVWGGFKPADIQVRDGQVFRRGVAVAVPEERDLFVLWGLDYIEPQERGRFVTRIAVGDAYDHRHQRNSPDHDVTNYLDDDGNVQWSKDDMP